MTDDATGPGSPAAPPAPAAAAAPPKPPPPPPAPSLTPREMIGPGLQEFLERKLASGDPVTVTSRKETFTGRVFRLMLDEGWIALEHEDGRRRAFFVIEGGKIGDGTVEVPFGAPPGH